MSNFSRIPPKIGKDENLDFYNDEGSDGALCANMSVIIDEARKLGFRTLCEYVEYLQIQNRNLRNTVHSLSLIAVTRKGE